MPHSTGTASLRSKRKMRRGTWSSCLAKATGEGRAFKRLLMVGVRSGIRTRELSLAQPDLHGRLALIDVHFRYLGEHLGCRILIAEDYDDSGMLAYFK